MLSLVVLFKKNIYLWSVLIDWPFFCLKQEIGHVVKVIKTKG